MCVVVFMLVFIVVFMLVLLGFVFMLVLVLVIVLVLVFYFVSQCSYRSLSLSLQPFWLKAALLSTAAIASGNACRTVIVGRAMGPESRRSLVDGRCRSTSSGIGPLFSACAASTSGPLGEVLQLSE